MTFLPGYRLLDMAWFGPGPFSARLLGDLGFDVIKITSPGPAAAPPMLFHEPPKQTIDAGFRRANARSIALDLKSEAGRAVLARLLKTADALQEGFRPGAAERLGIGYESVRRIKPDIVYASLSGYGQTGPYSDRAGHDLNYLATAGFIGMNGRAGDRPAIPGTVIADYAAGGMSAAVHILAALLRRERTGAGAYCDVSITDAAFALNALMIDGFLASGLEPRRGETLTSGFWPWYDVYETSDGAYVSVAAIEPQFFQALCNALGRPDLFDAQWSIEQREQIREDFRAQFRSRSRADWIALFENVDTCFAPVNTIAESIDDPQLRARGMITRATHPKYGDIPVIGSMLRFDGEAPRPRNWIVEPGQHTHEVLTEIGLSEDDIAELRAGGVIN